MPRKAVPRKTTRPGKKAAPMRTAIRGRKRARSVPTKGKPAVAPKPKASAAASGWQFESGGRKLTPYVPTQCPLCGSKQLVVRKPDSPAKVVGKVAAGLVVPLLIEFQARASCKVCGWRSEGTY